MLIGTRWKLEQDKSLSLPSIETSVKLTKRRRIIVGLAKRYTAWCSSQRLRAFLVCYQSVAGFLVTYVDQNKGSIKSLASALSALKVFSLLGGLKRLSLSSAMRGQ